MAGFHSLTLMVLTSVAVSVALPSRDIPLMDLGLVQTGHGFSVMRTEVTLAQWRACVADGGCTYMPKPGRGATRDDYPATGIGILDAQEFVAWAQKALNPALRLPTQSEWLAFSGVKPAKLRKIFTDPRLAWAATYGEEGSIDPTLKPSGGFGSNAANIADTEGNVWEWTSSCVNSARPDRCPAYFAMGLHEAKVSIFVRDPASGGCAGGTPPAHLGLRLVRDEPAQTSSNLQI